MSFQIYKCKPKNFKKFAPCYSIYECYSPTCAELKSPLLYLEKLLYLYKHPYELCKEEVMQHGTQS